MNIRYILLVALFLLHQSIFAEEEKLPIVVHLEFGLDLDVQEGKAIILKDKDIKVLEFNDMVGITKIEGLEQFTSLKEIRFFAASLDLNKTGNEFLEGMDQLEMLSFERVTMNALNTMFLGNVPHLKKLSMYMDLYDMDGAPYFILNKEMKALEDLNFTNVSISDVSFLQYLPNLKSLYITPWEGDVEHPATFSFGDDYNPQIWKQVSKLKALRLPKALHLQKGVLSRYTYVKETSCNTKGMKNAIKCPWE